MSSGNDERTRNVAVEGDAAESDDVSHTSLENVEDSDIVLVEHDFRHAGPLGLRLRQDGNSQGHFGPVKVKAANPKSAAELGGQPPTP